MNKFYLINKDTFADYEDLSISIKDSRLLNFVKKAQDLDLKLFLGHALYYDFVKQFEIDGTGIATLKPDATQPYQNLWNGCEYQDRHGHNIIFEGLIPALAYFTFARFVEADAIRYTATGPVVKKNDNSDALKASDITRIVEQHRSVALAHCREAEKFLWDNKEQFPLWHYNEKASLARQSGPRIRAIDRTDFNYPGGNSYNQNGLNLNEFLN